MSLLKQAEYIISQRKQMAEQAAADNYRKALEIPEIMEAEKEYGSVLPRYCRCEALGVIDEEIRAKYEKAREKRKQALKKYGFSEKDFLPRYNCPSCSDSGYKNGSPCSCLRQAINNIITESYGINVAQLPAFDYVDPALDEAVKAHLGGVYERMKKYCEGFPSTKFATHVFSGLTGTGKTHLACCVAKRVMERGYTVIFLTAFKLNEIFLRYHLDHRDGGRDYLENIYGCDLLVIDDLGTENIFKNVTVEYLLSLISERMFSGAHTLITTNLDGVQLMSRYGERLYSRLTDKRKTYIFQFTGENLRRIT
jgi:DNA replication protein DnaC